ncbi:MAG: cell division protein FtsX [Candidatus Dormibacteria bacterium]
MRSLWAAWRFVLHSSLQNFRRNLGVSLAGVCTMGLILVLVGLLSMGTVLLTSVLHDQESRASKLKIYIADGASLADVINFQHQLQKDPRVQSVTYENKDAAFAEAQSKGTGDIATAITALGSNPLPASLNVDVRQLRFLPQLNTMARADPLVDQTLPTDYNADVTSKIQAIINVIEGVVSAVSLMLLVVSLVIIMNTIRTAVYARRTEIEIMKLVGATDWFVRWPFILEGIIGGILGALLAAILVVSSYWLTVRVTAGNLFAIPFDGVLTIVVIASLFAGGGVIGAVGSYLGVRRFLSA